MTKNHAKIAIIILVLAITSSANAWVGGSTPKLQVQGRYLKDNHGNTVNLHGVAMTPSPWFNGGGSGIWRWNNYDVTGCLNYNNSVMDRLTDTSAGWYLNYIRLHMDPYWSNTPGMQTTGENDISAFNFERFKTAITNVIIPMINHAKSRGLYIILRPPGVCPEKIAVGDNYYKYLLKVWEYVSTVPELKNADNVMFELANEPVQIKLPDGTYGSNSQAHFDQLKLFFQPIVDTIRANGANNILWIPGTGYQSQYKGYAVNPIEGTNIGYAVHIYPGFLNGGPDYNAFKSGWNENVKPVADFAPIAITEVDWSPQLGVDANGKSYNMGTWGTGTTGTAASPGFGYNFKRIMDESGNVSWNLLAPEGLIDKGEPTGGIAFNNNPEACANACNTWFKDYSKVNFARPDFVYQSHSDNGDGTYTNPIISADFPDPDVIRVGNVYYMVSTTMFTFPGATILKSYDLVNWEFCSNPLEKIETSECYNLDGCNRYGRGQWASSLKYNNGTYYLHFNTLNEGSYLLTATDPAGPWTKKKLASSFYDAGLFFDDDGKIYIVYGINNLHIAQLDANFNVVKDQAITFGNVASGIDNSATEGSHLYKINGYYYIYATTGGYYATQVAYRSTSIFGPYDEKEVFNSNRIHQGALVETQTGEWWTILFADKGALGRFPNLLPVKWVDNWPVIGLNGTTVTTNKKPNVGKEYPVSTLPTNDNFRDYKLGMQWSWNHNSDNSKWSLTDRPDYLRLKTVSVVDSLHKAKNTLTQRIFAYPQDLAHSYGTIKMSIKNMQDGDVAGLAVFQNPYAYIGVKVISGQKKLIVENDKVQEIGIAITDSIIYLRSVVNYNTSTASFYYSTDNVTYTKFSTDLNMKFDLSVFTGNKFCLFNYATMQTGGYVDIDWFSTENDFTQDKFFDNTFVGYSASALTLTDILIDNTDITLLTGSTTGLTVRALYADGHSEDISIGATYTNSNPNIVRIVNGRIIAKLDGTATVTVSYKGALGDRKSVDLHITSSTFPLVNSIFNPSIYATGTFDQSTKTFVPGQWGFGGWNYSNGLDLSGYKYLVVKLGSAFPSGTVLRVFDENSYWSKPAEASFDANNQAVMNLVSAVKTGATTSFNRSHIYIVGLWANGGSPIMFSDAYVTNNSDYSKPSASDPLITALSSDATRGSVIGGGIYSNGYSCTLTAAPLAGYSFTNWTENGVIVSSNPNYAFTVNTVRTLVANFAISSNNCIVKTIDCSCTAVNDGAINLSFAVSAPYTITVSGNNFTKTINTPSAYTFTDLPSGTYNVNVTSTALVGYSLNYSVVISQPQSLSVSKVKEADGVVQYAMRGGQNYSVSLNGKVVSTAQSSTTLNLVKGDNRISIQTDKFCQGLFEENIFFAGDNQASVFPNPAENSITITIPKTEKSVVVEILSLNGNLVIKKLVDAQNSRILTMNVAHLSSGIYTVKVNGEFTNSVLKMVKK